MELQHQNALISAIKHTLALKIIEKIVNKLNDLNFGNSVHTHPLLCLSYTSHPDDVFILELFIKKGVNIDFVGLEKMTAAMLFSKRDNAKCLYVLLSNGADMNIVDKYGNTIHKYVKGNPNVEKILKPIDNFNIIKTHIYETRSVAGLKIMMEYSSLTVDQMCEILICAIKHGNGYIQTIIDNILLRGIELSSFEDRIFECCKDRKLSSGAISYLIMNGLSFGKILQNIQIDDNTDIITKTIYKLLGDLDGGIVTKYDKLSDEYYNLRANFGILESDMIKTIEELKKSNEVLGDMLISSQYECARLNEEIESHKKEYAELKDTFAQEKTIMDTSQLINDLLDE
mgnify:CR=1 FL=1